MRAPNERKLARAVPGIDLVLGGHDHVFISELVNDTLFLKSGTDFEEFTDLELIFG